MARASRQEMHVIFLSGVAICTDELFITESDVFILGVDLSGLSGTDETGEVAERLASIWPCSFASTAEGMRPQNALQTVFLTARM